MKKIICILFLLLAFTLTACSGQTRTSSTTDSSSSGIVTLNKDIWPQNEYTDGLPVSPGTVSGGTLDKEKGYCAIFLTDITDEEYQAYLEELQEKGFQITEEVSEEIDGQDYVSTGILLSDGERGLSISHIPNQLNLYISFLAK